jgi:hypothetical protein
MSRVRSDAQFDSIYSLTNRPRYTREGRFIPGTGVNLGRLIFGRASENSLADWYYDAAAGMLQLRLPWGMLNVSDPSTGRILFESDTVAAGSRSSQFECEGCSVLTGVPNDGFRMAAVALRNGVDIAGSIPQAAEGRHLPASSFTTWRWKTWEQPTWHEYVKPTYAALRDLWAQWK